MSFPSTIRCQCDYSKRPTVLYETGFGLAQPEDPAYKAWLIEEYHHLWRELHSKQDATPEWFLDWIDRVPSIGCGCRKWLREYLATNPPWFDNFYEWGVVLHDAVNFKLDKPAWDRIIQSD